ncbi:MAG: RepB family DNA primase, partial [Thaumarchaeota archaeon]|nr:RepB family DNA primase [Nitrososphaerota archaeon]
MPEPPVQTSIDFLRYLFGEPRDGLIYVWGTKGVKDQPGFETVDLYYEQPGKLKEAAWEDRIVKKFNVFFGTATAKERGKRHKAANCGQVPAIWFDIDVFKKIIDPRTQEPLISGEEWLQDHRIQDPEVSAWVRSSEHGIQGFYKLNEPWLMDGDAEAFDEKVRPLLQDLAWYYGGDLAVCSPGRLMRLPGTMNRKAEYKDAWPVTCETYDSRIHTIKALKERYPQDFDACPLAFFDMIVKLMQPVWIPKERHKPSLALAGSVRAAGLDKKSCKRLLKEMARTLGDSDDRAGNVDSTYDHDINELATIEGGDYDFGAVLLDVLKAWVELKAAYAKARGIDWTPETYDPITDTDRSVGNRKFYEKDGATWYHSKDDGDQMFANFTMRLVKRVVKCTEFGINVVAIITKAHGSPMTIELTAAQHNSWEKFSRVPGLEAGIVITLPPLWSQYILYLDEVAAGIPVVRENLYYGVLGEKEPTLLLPGEEHPKWLWASERHQFDPMLPGAFERDLAGSDIHDYLSGLFPHLTDYQAVPFWISVLGWFCAAPMSAMFRRNQILKGMPILLVTGRKGSGKSTLTHGVIGHHFGCKTPKSLAKGATTVFALKRNMGSSNIGVLATDELRNDPYLMSQIAGRVRDNWDGADSESGTASGATRRDPLITPWCIVGESAYEDPAAWSRTFSVRVASDWVKGLSKGGSRHEEYPVYEVARKWLHDAKWSGMLGTLLIRELQEDLAGVDTMIELADKTIKETCPVPDPRKVTGYTVAYVGLLLLKRVFKRHGVPFPMGKEERLQALYDADEEVFRSTDSDDMDMGMLMQRTDALIVDGIRRHMRYCPSMYIVRDGVAYFQLSRWIQEIGGVVDHSETGTLKNRRGFL